MRAGEMAQQVRAVVKTPDYLSLILSPLASVSALDNPL